MLSCVSFNAKQFKVLKTVVVLDAVSVVNVLARPETSAKVASHNETVLKGVSLAVANDDVAVTSDESPGVALGSAALGRAEAGSAAPGFDLESSAAILTSESDRH